MTDFSSILYLSKLKRTIAFEQARQTVFMFCDLKEDIRGTLPFWIFLGHSHSKIQIFPIPWWNTCTCMGSRFVSLSQKTEQEL